jgi:hypothetical protein
VWLSSRACTNRSSQKSTCVVHDAVDEPDREAYGTAASGIGTVDCVRHNMKRPNGVGDLQKGERYVCQFAARTATNGLN